MLGLALMLMLLAGAVLSIPGRGSGHAARASRSRARPSRPSGGRRPVRASSEVARVLVEVAARLRAGSPMAAAWRRSLPAPPPSWADPVLAETAAYLAAPTRAPTAGRPRDLMRRWHERAGRRREPAAGDVAAAVAACRLAARTGAPLAEVIDVVVGGIAEAAEAANLRRTALAGPRATAKLLGWLPVGGVALGTALGADPIGVLLGGGLGGLCLVGGLALFAVGNRWIAALVTDAERAGR